MSADTREFTLIYGPTRKKKIEKKQLLTETKSFSVKVHKTTLGCTGFW